MIALLNHNNHKSIVYKSDKSTRITLVVTTRNIEVGHSTYPSVVNRHSILNNFIRYMYGKMKVHL